MSPRANAAGRGQGGRRGTLSRDRVLETALAVVDEEGVKGLTMRRVASELGVDPMALYRHVESKDALLDGVVEMLWRQVPPPSPDQRDWVESLRSFAHAWRAALTAHPNAAELMLTRPVFPRPALEAYRTLLGVFRDAGFDDAQAAQIVRSVTSTALSDAISTMTYRTLTRSGSEAMATSEADAWISLAQTLPDDTPPELVRVAYAICAPTEAATDFSFIIDLILHGAQELKREG